MSARIYITNILVDDQARALEFYTEKLGFVPKMDVPAGEYRWLTVVGADDADGVELLLEPDAHPAAKAYKDTLHADGMPYTSIAVDDVRATFAELSEQGVQFMQDPTVSGPFVTAVLNDTVGNWIQIISPGE